MPDLGTNVAMTIGPEVAGKYLSDNVMKKVFGDVPEANAVSGLRGVLDLGLAARVAAMEPSWTLRQLLEYLEQETKNTD